MKANRSGDRSLLANARRLPDYRLVGRLADAVAGANGSHWLHLTSHRFESDGFLPQPRVRAPTTPEFSSKKSLLQSLAAGLGAKPGYKRPTTSLSPPLPSLLSPSPFAVAHSTHGTFTTSPHHTIGSLRTILFHSSLPEPSHSVGTVGICQHGKHRQRYIQSRCTPASALVVGTHSLARGQSTLYGLSADVSRRLAAWAPWAYQRINFASGLT